MHTFLLGVMFRAGLLGHRLCICCSRSVYTAKSFQKWLYQFPLPPGVYVSSSCFILSPKQTLIHEFIRKYRKSLRVKKKASKLKPPIKWNLNRKPVLVWGPSGCRESFQILGGWETRSLEPQNGGAEPGVCLQREMTRTLVSHCPCSGWRDLLQHL